MKHNNILIFAANYFISLAFIMQINDNINNLMFDKQKMKELEQRSHNRGLLSKEFYLNEQQQLERKRREMKAELDRQVEERRRQKEQEKLQNQRRLRKQEEEIKNYYKHLESREKRTSANQSSALHASNMKQATQPYQTYPTEQQADSRHKGASLSKNKAGHSRPALHDAEIPLLTVMPSEISKEHSVLAISKQSIGNIGSIANIGNIPLLNLSDDPNPNKFKKTKQKTTKREKTLEAAKESQQRIQNSRQAANNPPSIALRDERRSTIPDQQSIFGSVVQAAEKNDEIPQEVIEMEQENKSLKVQLRKKQQALSLLMGAVRSNGGKLQKYRVQAERILHGQAPPSRTVEQKQDERVSMLPKIHMKNQSIMYDYILTAARRGRKAHL